MTYSYLIQTDTEPIAVTLTASGRIALSQAGVTVYLPGASWDTLRAAVDALHPPDAPNISTPARTGRTW